MLIFCFFLVWGFVEAFLTWLFVLLFGFGWVVFSVCLCGAWGFVEFLFSGFFAWGFRCFGGALPSHRRPSAQAHTLDSLVSPMCVTALPLPDATLHAGDTVPGARLTS